MQAGGDGFGWRVTAEHMTFQDPGVFIPRHICKVPGKEKNRVSKRNNRERKKHQGDEDDTRDGWTSFSSTQRQENCMRVIGFVCSVSRLTAFGDR